MHHAMRSTNHFLQPFRRKIFKLSIIIFSDYIWYQNLKFRNQICGAFNLWADFSLNLTAFQLCCKFLTRVVRGHVKYVLDTIKSLFVSSSPFQRIVFRGNSVNIFYFYFLIFLKIINILITQFYFSLRLVPSYFQSFPFLMIHIVHC